MPDAANGLESAGRRTKRFLIVAVPIIALSIVGVAVALYFGTGQPLPDTTKAEDTAQAPEDTGGQESDDSPESQDDSERDSEQDDAAATADDEEKKSSIKNVLASSDNVSVGDLSVERRDIIPYMLAVSRRDLWFSSYVVTLTVANEAEQSVHVDPNLTCMMHYTDGYGDRSTVQLEPKYNTFIGGMLGPNEVRRFTYILEEKQSGTNVEGEWLDIDLNDPDIELDSFGVGELEIKSTEELGPTQRDEKIIPVEEADLSVQLTPVADNARWDPSGFDAVVSGTFVNPLTSKMREVSVGMAAMYGDAYFMKNDVYELRAEYVKPGERAALVENADCHLDGSFLRSTDAKDLVDAEGNPQAGYWADLSAPTEEDIQKIQFIPTYISYVPGDE